MALSIGLPNSGSRPGFYMPEPYAEVQMNRTLLAATLAVTLPALAADEPMVVTELNGMDIEVVELGVPGVDFSSDLDVEGVPAVRVINRDNVVASCQFRAEPEETVMASTPSYDVDPNEEVVLRVPGKYSAGGPFAILVCQPVGVTPDDRPVVPGRLE